MEKDQSKAVLVASSLEDVAVAGKALLTKMQKVLDSSWIDYLTQEEINLLAAFRIFKKQVTKHSIFKFEVNPEKKDA